MISFYTFLTSFAASWLISEQISSNFSATFVSALFYACSFLNFLLIPCSNEFLFISVCIFAKFGYVKISSGCIISIPASRHYSSIVFFRFIISSLFFSCIFLHSMKCFHSSGLLLQYGHVLIYYLHLVLNLACHLINSMVSGLLFNSYIIPHLPAGLNFFLICSSTCSFLYLS